MGFIILIPLPVFPSSGSQILEDAFQANVRESFRSELVLDTKTKRGKKYQLKFTMLGKGDPRKDFSLLLIFQDPPSSRGMKLLVLARRNSLSRVYVYMPALKKHFRLVGEDRNMKLGDSDMSLYDLVVSPWEGKHKLISKKNFEGKPCYSVETILPGNKNKRITCIGETTLLPLNSRYFDFEGNLLKTIAVLSFKKVFRKHAITSLRVTNHENNSVTTMKVLSGQWYIDIPREVFYPDHLRFSLSELMEIEKRRF